ncbi:hypothetical protein KAT72_18400 [Aeromonas popoffii]|jgi:hypothetical protein|uniref:YokE-like PH domain-containing protein n=1 Tax=Aeromonas popoffii TaxID=70856 RepID=A0ABS5GUW7_9GAMM|nr:hypothetical protein [Aeromonas popoffii]MBR7630936.1 hypothetical protein [Aeromonas popoffii]
MKREAIVEEIELNPLGEIRMGCDAFGVVIKTNFGNFDLFKNTPIIIGNTDHSKVIVQSKCKRYLLVKGSFDTYILDIKDQSISIYKKTIRGTGNEWSEEQAIFGKDKTHIKGFDQTYYLQFPFVRQSEFNAVLSKYESLRKAQIEVAVNAL